MARLRSRREGEELTTNGKLIPFSFWPATRSTRWALQRGLLNAGMSAASILAELKSSPSKKKTATVQRPQHTPRTRRQQHSRPDPFDGALHQFHSQPSHYTDEELEALQKAFGEREQERKLERERIAAEERRRQILRDPRWRWFDEKIARTGFAQDNGRICRTDVECGQLQRAATPTACISGGAAAMSYMVLAASLRAIEACDQESRKFLPLEATF